MKTPFDLTRAGARYLTHIGVGNEAAIILLCVLSTMGLLNGCAVGPDYKRPDAPAPVAYKELGDWKPATPKDDKDRGPWWAIFGDVQLNTLEDQLEISNQNLAQAEARFRQSRALMQSTRAGSFPSATGNLSSTRTGRADNKPTSQHDIALSARWEADVWGKIRRSVEANVANAQASAADLASARLSAQAQLAQSYFQLRVLDEQKRLFNDTVAAYQKSLDLTRNRYAVGVAAKTDVAQAETQLKTTQAQAIDLGIQRARLEHAIAVLIGKPPQEFSLPPAPFTLTQPPIPLGVPSELLERRPDIAAAERRIAEANAQIGITQAAFFPNLTLSASDGYQSSSFTNWLTAPNRVWSFGPALAATLFDGGTRRAQVKQATATYDLNVANYRQTVLAAFQQVEDYLAQLRILEQEAKVQDEAVKAAEESLHLTHNQYKAGIVSYLNVATAQTAVLNNQRSALIIRGDQLSGSVSLIEALGGEWNTKEIPTRKQLEKFSDRK